MTKMKIVFSLILLFAIISACYLLVLPVKYGVEVDDDKDDVNLTTLSTPKSSGYDVTPRCENQSEEEVLAVAVSADGKYMAVGTSDGNGPIPQILFFDTSDNTGMPLWTYEAPAAVNSLAISDNGEYIVAECPGAGTPEAFLLNWTVPDPGEDKQIIWKVTGFQETTVDISADGDRIAVGGWDGSSSAGYIITFDNLYPAGGGDNKGADFLWLHSRSGEHVSSVAISDDGKYVAVGFLSDVPNEVLFYNLTDYTKGTSQEPMWGFNTATDVDDLAISDDGYYIAAAGEDTCYLLNRTYPDAGQDKTAVWNASFSPLNYDYTSIDISGDGKSIVAGIDSSLEEPLEGMVLVFNSSYSLGGSKIDEYLWVSYMNGTVNSVSITDDGNYVVVGTDYNPHTGDIDENTVFLFNNTDYLLGGSHDPEWVFNTSNNVNSVSISSKWGNYIASGGESGITPLGETFLFYHAVPIPPGPILPGGDDDDDDDDDTGIIVVVVVIIVLASIGGVVVVIVVLIKKGIIDISKLKRG